MADETAFKTIPADDGALILSIFSGGVETLARLSVAQARDLAQLLLASADEASGKDARF